MDTYDDSTYGERIAAVYDDLYSTYDETAINALADLAGAGRALELGIGTGRVALPLAKKGVEVHGIDASAAMVTRLRDKPGGEAIPVTIGSFARVAVAGEFSLIYVVFNTFFGLLSQAEQVDCFRNVARRLTPEGVFLLELFVPDMTRFDRNQRVDAFQVANDSLKLDVSIHDPVQQVINATHVLMTEDTIRLYPIRLRYAWPSELDLMAQLAGLRLRQRWGGWQQEPFTAKSEKHISVYERVT